MRGDSPVSSVLKNMDLKQQLFASRASEKAPSALYVLATSEGSLADRLTEAWIYQFGMLSGRSLPGEFQERFDHMHELVTTADPMGNSGQIERSIRAMSSEDAQALARLMVGFAIDVERAIA